MLRFNRSSRMLMTSFTAVLLQYGCSADTGDLDTLSVEAVALRQSRGEVLQFADANTVATRAKYGVIEGAVLLSNHRDYDLAELAFDRGSAIVFYCHSPRCGAAVDAARRARSDGIEPVFVMPAGITGWVAANRPVVAKVSQ